MNAPPPSFASNCFLASSCDSIFLKLLEISDAFRHSFSRLRANARNPEVKDSQGNQREENEESYAEDGVRFLTLEINGHAQGNTAKDAMASRCNKKGAHWAPFVLSG